MFLERVMALFFLTAIVKSDRFAVQLNSVQLSFLANALPADYASISSNEWSLLAPLLIARPPGSEGHKKVFEYIVAHFDKLEWTVEVDSFSDMTPKGPITFSNIIASSNPDAKNRLVLAAHYDSKIIEGIEFIGATVFFVI
jgi:hypothetical protein